MRVENVGVEMKGLWEIERRGWRSVLDEPGARREGSAQPCPSGVAGRQVFMGVYGYLWVFMGLSFK